MHSLMIYWAGLYDTLSREQMVEGVDTMLKLVKEVLADQTARQVNRLLLQEEAPQDSDEE